MSDQIQRVLECSQRLSELRQRIGEVEEQRNALKGEIDRCLEELASLTAGRLAPPADLSPSARVLWLLRRDPSRPMAPSDVAYALGIQSRQELKSIGGLMSRMGREGRLRRVAHGRYLAPEHS
jgi:hypothetical protein